MYGCGNGGGLSTVVVVLVFLYFLKQKGQAGGRVGSEQEVAWVGHGRG